MHGPTTAPAAPPPSPPGWELSGADGGEYGGEGCQMLACVLPHPTPGGDPSAVSPLWTSGALEGMQG